MTDRKTTLARADEALAHIEATFDSASESEKRLARGYAATRVRTDFSTPAYAPLTMSQKFGTLVEECGEVLQAAGKTIRWGLKSTNPELPAEKQETNREWVRRELRDLKRAIEIVEQGLDEET